MLQALLTDSQAQWLRQEKQALSEIQETLAHLDIPRPALETLREATLQLDELFLVVVVGEFNAGKSALVNALLGAKVLAEGPTPTTSRVTLVKWGEKVQEQIVDEGFSVFSHPLPLLHELNIVDTPGTNAVIRHHERLTEEFVPRSDLVLFVTSADHPMTESERVFLERIRTWGKKVVVALNKIDILENDTTREEVRDFVLKHVQQVLGSPPEIFSVSARLAQWASSDPDPEKRTWMRRASHIDELARYISTTLDNHTRLELKLGNPLGVASRIVEQAAANLKEETEALSEDLDTVKTLESLVTRYEKELNDELGPRLAQVDNILQRMQQRGLDFFDTTLRLTNIVHLTRGDQIRAQFEHNVLDDVPHQIEDTIQRLIEWLVQRNLSQWQQVMALAQKQNVQHADHITGESIASLDARRRTLLESVGETAQGIVESFDQDKQAHDLAVAVETTVAQVALLEAGAVGLGAWVVTVLASSAADFTGLLAAGTLAIVGFFIIPYKRKQSKDDFRNKIDNLRIKLSASLTAQFTREVDQTVARMREGIAPYTRFVHAETDRTTKATTDLELVQQRISSLRSQLSQL